MTRAKPLAVCLFVIGCAILWMQLFLAPTPNWGLCLLGGMNVGYALAATVRRPNPNRKASTDPCIGGDSCACPACAAKALTIADRDWLARHGWQEPDAMPPSSGPKRSGWQTALDRAIASESSRITQQIRASSPRNERIDVAVSRQGAAAQIQELRNEICQLRQ